MAAWAVTVAIPVLWGDMDALGHVNNTRYFRWFESARIALFHELGMETNLDGSGFGPNLATASCDFLQPIVYPSDLVVGARATRVGRTSITVEYGLWPAGRPEELVARGSSVIVLIVYATGEKVPVPDDLR